MNEEMLDALGGETLIAGAKWFENNDTEILEWVMDSQYCDFEREEAIIEVIFTKFGVQYYACAEWADCDTPSQNQPPWGEDDIEDWQDADENYIKKYYNAIFDNDIENIFDFLTMSEALEKYDISSPSNLRKAMKNEWKDFKLGNNCRKSGDNWIMNRDIIEQNFEEK